MFEEVLLGVVIACTLITCILSGIESCCTVASRGMVEMWSGVGKPSPFWRVIRAVGWLAALAGDSICACFTKSVTFLAYLQLARSRFTKHLSQSLDLLRTGSHTLHLVRSLSTFPAARLIQLALRDSAKLLGACLLYRLMAL